MKIAVYPGSFDPITYGHIDIIERACEIFDKLYIAIAVNSSKKTLFTLEERKELIEKVLTHEKKEIQNKIEVTIFKGLLTAFAREVRAVSIVRGIRAVTDFDYEYAIYQANRELAPEIDTVFLLASKEYSFISSSILKEVARYGRTLGKYAPKIVNDALLTKYGHQIEI